jgi:hypothetical protein
VDGGKGNVIDDEMFIVEMYEDHKWKSTYWTNGVSQMQECPFPVSKARAEDACRIATKLYKPTKFRISPVDNLSKGGPR